MKHIIIGGVYMGKPWSTTIGGIIGDKAIHFMKHKCCVMPNHMIICNHPKDIDHAHVITICQDSQKLKV